MAAIGLALALATLTIHGAPAAATLDPQTTGANITRATINLLEQSQFAHHPFDAQLAAALLDRYLDSLDGTRTLFLQDDIDEFARYRATLAQATHLTGDTRAAMAIFERYVRRLDQRVSYVTSALKTEKFDFSGHDAYVFDRKDAQRPRDLKMAQTLWRQALRAEYLQEKLLDKAPAQITKTLTERYTQQLRTVKALHDDEVLAVYLNALAHVYDPHSDYLGHEQMESFSIAMNLSLFGIGATLESADGYCKVRELVPGGPAARSGVLKPGDRIIAVAQAGQEPVDIVNMPLSRAVELIRGPKGSRVTLTIIPGDSAGGSTTKTETIVRDEVKLEDQQAKARIIDLPRDRGATLRLGVIELASFYSDVGGHEGTRRHGATADVARLLEKLKTEHVRGIVLDLRHNGGGSLEEAINLTGLFIRKGPVVQIRQATGAVDVGTDTDSSVLYAGPLVVLTSRFSASASEIVAGALQDYGRALIVGDAATFGKGTVQTVVPLAKIMEQAHLAYGYDPGALKVTVAKFYRPSGASTQLRGVASDIVLPSTSDFSDVNESALKDPLPWDTIRPTAYEKVNRVQPYVDVLREKSKRRVATEQDFQSLGSELAVLRKNLATKSASLNEAERREQLVQSRARHKELEREARALNATGRTYEITLKNASLPGLPNPDALSNRGHAPSAPASTGSEVDSDDVASSRAADDILLRESERILADYVDALR